MTRVLMLGAIALSLALTGCGTVQNFALSEGEMRPLEIYGGVARSVDGVNSAFAHPVGYIIPLSISDVVFSAVGDTLTLPITLAVSAARAIDAHYHLKKGPESEARPRWREFWFKDYKPPILEPERIEGGIL